MNAFRTAFAILLLLTGSLLFAADAIRVYDAGDTLQLTIDDAGGDSAVTTALNEYLAGTHGTYNHADGDRVVFAQNLTPDANINVDTNDNLTFESATPATPVTIDVRNVTSYGFYVHNNGADGGTNNVIRNLVFESDPTSGMKGFIRVGYNCFDNVISNCVFQDAAISGTKALKFESACNGLLFAGNIVRNLTGTGGATAIIWSDGYMYKGVIRNNIFSNIHCGGNGVVWIGNGDGGRMLENVVSNNLLVDFSMSDNHVGICIDGNASNIVAYNVISNAATEKAIFIGRPWADQTQATNNFVIGNVIDNCKQGVQVKSVTNNYIISNMISRAAEYTIYLNKAVGTRVEGNTLTSNENGTANNNIAIYLDEQASNNVIVGNTIVDHSHAISVGCFWSEIPTAVANEILSNIVYDGTTAVRIRHSGATLIEGNAFYQLSGNAVDIEGGFATNTHVKGKSIFSNNTGASAAVYHKGVITNTRIESNTIFSNLYAVFEQANGGGNVGTTVIGNTVYNVAGNAFQFEGTSRVVAGNTVSASAGFIGTGPVKGYAYIITNNTVHSLNSGAHGINFDSWPMSNAVIEGNTIYGVERGINVSDVGATNVRIVGNTVYSTAGDAIVVRASNALVSRNVVYDSAGNGITAQGVTNAIITENIVTTNAGYGVNLYNGVSNVLVASNTIVSNARGIDENTGILAITVLSNVIGKTTSFGISVGDYESTISYNEIYETGSYPINFAASENYGHIVHANTIHDTSYEAIFLNTSASNMVIGSNTIYNTKSGVEVFDNDATNVTVISNTISNVTGANEHGVYTTADDTAIIDNAIVSVTGHAVYVTEAMRPIVRGNVMSNALTTDTSAGIFLYNGVTNAEVSGNTIHGASYGVRSLSGTYDNVNIDVIGNDIRGITNAGGIQLDETDVTVLSNTVIDAANFGINLGITADKHQHAATIAHNYVSNVGDHALFARAISNSTIASNTFCVTTGADASGVFFEYDASTNNMLVSNAISATTGAPIRIGGVNNVLMLNSIHDVDDYITLSKAGNIVAGNIFYNMTGNGIMFQEGDNTVVSNTFSNIGGADASAIRFQSGSVANSVMFNTFASNVIGVNIFASTLNNCVVVSNYFTNHSAKAIHVSSGGNTILSNVVVTVPTGVYFYNTSAGGTVHLNDFINIASNSIAGIFSGNAAGITLGTNYYGAYAYASLNIDDASFLSSAGHPVTNWALAPIAPLWDYFATVTTVGGSTTLPSGNVPHADNKVTITWDNATGEAGYHVYRIVTNNNYSNATLIKTVGADTTTVDDFPPPPTRTWYYYVTAYDANGNEGWFSTAAEVVDYPGTINDPPTVTSPAITSGATPNNLDETYDFSVVYTDDEGDGPEDTFGVSLILSNKDYGFTETHALATVVGDYTSGVTFTLTGLELTNIGDYDFWFAAVGVNSETSTNVSVTNTISITNRPFTLAPQLAATTNGNAETEYTLKVLYQDLDNHGTDILLRYDISNATAGGAPYGSFLSFDSWKGSAGDYVTGAYYSVTTTFTNVKRASTEYTYRFRGQNSVTNMTDAYVATAAPWPVTITNVAPTLTNFAASTNQGIAYLAPEVVFSVTYADADNDNPTNNAVYLVLSNMTTTDVTTNVMTNEGVAADFTAGSLFSFATNMGEAGDYAFFAFATGSNFAMIKQDLPCKIKSSPSGRSPGSPYSRSGRSGRTTDAPSGES